MTDKPKPLAQLAKVKAYVPGEAPKPGKGPSYKLASNENPLGASPKAKAVYADMGGKLEIYPDGGAGALKAAIAKKNGLDPNRIIVGAGSDEIFLMLGRVAMESSGEDDTLATAHDDHYIAERRLADVGLKAEVVARARSLCLIRIREFVSVDDRRVDLARKAGLDGLRVVGVRPRP